MFVIVIIVITIINSSIIVRSSSSSSSNIIMITVKLTVAISGYEACVLRTEGPDTYNRILYYGTSYCIT